MKMMVRFLLSFALVSSATCSGQSQTGKAETSGFCSPAVTGTNNQFTITCQNIPEKLRAQLVDLLNRVAKNQADAEAIMGKLDGCLEGIREVREQQAPWSLSAPQKAELISILSTKKFNKTAIGIGVLPSDRNSSLMGSDLLDVLKQARWNVSEGYITDYTLSPSLAGIAVVVNHEDFPEATFLLNALRKVGIDAFGVLDDPSHKRIGTDNSIFIAVGAKPSPSR